MPTPITYDYAIVRVVPRVERGEFVNVGVVVSCDAGAKLEARIAFDPARVRALDPQADLDAIEAALDSFVAICRGDPRSGRLARLGPRERFHWLVAPRSAVIQTSPVHTGRALDVGAALERLLARVVHLPVRPDEAPSPVTAAAGPRR